MTVLNPLYWIVRVCSVYKNHVIIDKSGPPSKSWKDYIHLLARKWKLNKILIKWFIISRFPTLLLWPIRPINHGKLLSICLMEGTVDLKTTAESIPNADFTTCCLRCLEQNVVTSLSYLPGLHHSTAWSVREWRGSQDQHHPTRYKKKLLSLNLSEIFVLSWREK